MQYLSIPLVENDREQEAVSMVGESDAAEIGRERDGVVASGVDVDVAAAGDDDVGFVVVVADA